MTADAPRVREASEEDVPALTVIYRHAVLHGTASFEIEPPDADEMLGRLRAVQASGGPYLAAADPDGRLLGYAYAARFRPRPAYRWTLEDSVYVAPEAKGRGVGRALLTALIDRAAAAGARMMVAVVGDPDGNPASVALHRACDFRESGRLAAVGWKAGAWRDSLLMQRPLGAGTSTPP